ncbi:carboxylesterase/lipase family protein [Streptomyces sp. NBC_00038]|uniref:carboxylesterase/lipase family protein n=1 Tax=Streptomyces sp. NBC_00038 TaxID=2903615 RepID=UPI002250F83F|nr:carboxylesterase family protein [Streptomyces sp. NBC_00038]MCX5561890.1 carboxylesterase family protein [Streptomyces sp. NBC_00038]
MGQGSSAASGDTGQVVRTANGAVRGVLDGGHRVFNGIPYAEPPVGELRWKPPRPASPWSGVRSAAKPAADCVQTAVAWRPAAASTDEDCLSLNVWAPKKASKGTSRPVAVWFHGGGSVNGAGRDFEPVSMAEQGDLLVVTVNYRLGALGYLTLPELDEAGGAGASGNYGLLDQIEALRWVERNIADFGGDPGQVMIAGQSAGAGGVCALLASPEAAGLFTSAVIQSSTCGVTSRETAQKNNAAFVTALGCDARSAPATVACLRGKPPSDIINAQRNTGSWGRVIQEGVLPVTAQEAFRSGDFNRVPVLVGGTAHEDRAFVYEQNDLVSQPVTEAAHAAAVRAQFGTKADAILARYPVSAYESPGAALAQVQTDGPRVCSGVLPNAAALTRTVPTYVYEFRDETAPLRPYELVPSSFSLATQHSAELPYLWGANTATPLSAKQRQLSHDMIAYWAEFARTGSLAPKGLPAVPRYSAAAPREVAFDSGGPRVVDDMAVKHQCAFWATLS